MDRSDTNKKLNKCLRNRTIWELEVLPYRANSEVLCSNGVDSKCVCWAERQKRLVGICEIECLKRAEYSLQPEPEL